MKNIRIKVIDTTGPFLAILTTCELCDERLSTRIYDVREDLMQTEVHADAQEDAQAARQHLDTQHPGC